MSNDLGAVVSTGKGTVEVTLPTAQADIDTAYDDALMKLRTRPMIIKGEASRDEITARQVSRVESRIISFVFEAIVGPAN